MSGQGTSVVVSIPGKPNWHMRWGNGFDNFQLDIVGFLAVLGEGSVTANAQVSALSPLFYLPRLIPAPQALLWPKRPVELEPTKASVTGVESGIVKEHVHHVANVLLGSGLAKWEVRCVEVTKAPDRPRAKTLNELIFGVKQEDASKDPEKDQNDKQTPIGPAVVTAKKNGPLAWVTIASFLLSVIMLFLSVLFGDGYSMIATLLLSFLSTLIGVVNKSTLSLPQRPRNSNEVDFKHVVVRYPNGSFLVVKCDENVARELYFAPEEIDYQLKSTAATQFISLLGTIMLMGGVIFLANARLQLQFAWGGAYIITNILHWMAAAVPSRLHWDLSCYIVKEHGIASGPKGDNFTDALWKTIVFTKQADWAHKGAAPDSPVWDEWLQAMQARTESLGWYTSPHYEAEPEWKDHRQPPEYSPSYTIWDVPPKFDAKAEWDKINADHKLKKQIKMTTAVVNSTDSGHG